MILDKINDDELSCSKLEKAIRRLYPLKVEQQRASEGLRPTGRKGGVYLTEVDGEIDDSPEAYGVDEEEGSDESLKSKMIFLSNSL